MHEKERSPFTRRRERARSPPSRTSRRTRLRGNPFTHGRRRRRPRAYRVQGYEQS